MPNDPYAVLRALLRAEAARSAPKPHMKATDQEKPRQAPKDDRGR
ncbi:hypothetical protein ACIHAR_35940 [Streptomyces sp. NPDC052016]|jgi:hypothetical protein